MRKSLWGFAACVAAVALAAPAYCANPETDAQKGMDLFEQFNVITLGDFHITNNNTHVEGKTFIGGALTGGTLKVGGGNQGAASDYAELTVHGNASGWDVESSQTTGRNALIQIGGSSTGSATLNGSGGHVDVGGTFNFSGFNPSSSKTVTTGETGLADTILAQETTFSTDLHALSDTLAALPGTAIDLGTKLSFTGDYAVYTMTAAQFATTNYDFGSLFSSLTADQTVIINVLGTSLSEGSGANYNGTAASVLWNFNAASSVNLVATFSGSILAPDATVTQSGSNIYGSVAAQLFNGNAEVHLGNFSGTTPFLVPNTPPTGGVPEPASWMTMLLGFGLIGSLIRSQRRKERLAAA